MDSKSLLLALLVSISSAVHAETISVDEGGVTFEAPDDFTPVSEEVLRIKYPSGNAPRFVIGNEGAGTTIAYDIKPSPLPSEQLDAARTSFTELFERMIPGIEWVENKTIDHDGQEWIYFELTSNAIDTEIYNIMLMTGYGDQTLMFNFNSTKEQFGHYESALRQSLQSIDIR